MTVSYSAGVFSIYDGEESVSDLVTEKGGALATTDTTYIYTSATEGILGVGDGEKMIGAVHAGRNSSGVKSDGTLKVYGGGEVERTGEFEIVPHYGSFETSATSSSKKALIDANNDSNDLILNGSISAERLQITNINTASHIDLDLASGYITYLESSGYGSGTYGFKGIPQDNFFIQNASIGRGKSGFYTEDHLNDIDLSSDNVIEFVRPRSSSSFGFVSVPGRATARLARGANNPSRFTVGVRLGETKLEQTLRDLEVYHTRQEIMLIVLRAHGSDQSFPVDYIIRGYILDPLQSYNPGTDYQTIQLTVVEET